MTKKSIGILLIIFGIFVIILGLVNFYNEPSYIFDIKTILRLIIIFLPLCFGIHFVKDYNREINPIIKCKFCQSEIDSKAKVCPVCHRTLQISLAAIIVTLFLAYILIAYIIMPMLLY